MTRDFSYRSSKPIRCVGPVCKYTMFGVLFGCLFPVVATGLELAITPEGWSWANLLAVQAANPLLWIIDTAPIFLGLFAWFIGLRTSAGLQAERNLRLHEEKFRTVVQASNDAMLAIDSRGLIFLFNQAAERLFDISEKDAIGQPVTIIMPGDVRAFHQQYIEGIFKKGRNLDLTTKSRERTLRSASGEEITIELTFAEGHLGDETFILVVIRDIREKKKAAERERQLQDRLAKAEKMKSLGLLAGGVAHDLNNMLGPLVGYPELILRKLPPESPIRKQVERIGLSARDAADVVQDLLALARRGRYDMISLNLNDVITAYLESPGYQALQENRSDLEVNVQLDPRIGAIEGSAPHLSKLIMNLVANAFDAVAADGAVTIKTSQRYIDSLQGNPQKIEAGEYVCLTIADTGIGINEEDMSRIFEPYYSKKEMGRSGSGLGLSVVYGVLKDHHGYYDIFSKVGAGTQFALYFPVSKTPIETASPQAAEAGGAEYILIVDDDDAQRQLTVETLDSFGYKTVAVSSGEEAVRFLEKASVDLIVMDMIMGSGMDGLDTYREIIKTHPGQKAIIVSGFSSSRRVVKMQELGAGAYVMKPFTPDIIARAIRKELSRIPVPVA